MAMEISGKLIKKMPVQSGSSDRGTWSRQDIIIETPGQYPKSVCISLWGDRVNDAVKYNEGDLLKISFDIQSREYNERWYTDVRAWRIEKERTAAPAETASYQSAPTPAPAAAIDDPFAATSDQQVDDLPF